MLNNLAKRALCAVMSVALVAGLCPALAYAGDSLRRTGSLASQVSDIASGTCGTCTWVIDADGLLTIRPTNGTSGQLDEPKYWGELYKEVFGDAPWAGSSDAYYPWTVSSSDAEWVQEYYGVYRDRITGIKVEQGVKAGYSTYCMFKGMSLSSLDLTNLDTSNTHDMQNMFWGTSAPLDSIASLNTGNVENMGAMFCDATSSTGMDLTAWNVENVQAMYYMFGCYTGPSVILPDNPSSCISYFGMFAGAVIESLDLSSLDNSAATCTWMFGPGYGVTELKSLAVRGAFDFNKLDCLPNLGTEGNNWWSVVEQKWFTPEEVKTTRSGIADTYCSTETPQTSSESTTNDASTITDGETTEDEKREGDGSTADKTSSADGKTTGDGKNESNRSIADNKSAIEAPGSGEGSESLSADQETAIKFANPMKVSSKVVKVKRGKKKAVKVPASKSFEFTGRTVGAVTYMRVSKGSSKWLSVGKKGVITVKKRAPKKTHVIRVKVLAAGDASYESASVTVAVKVKVK